MSDPFGCGHAVIHFGDPFLLWLWLCGQSLLTIGSDTTIGFIFYIFHIYEVMGIVMVIFIERLWFYMVI